MLGPSKHRTTAVLASTVRGGPRSKLPQENLSLWWDAGEGALWSPTVEPKSLAKRILLSAAG